MGDRCYVTVTIGGTIPENRLEALAAAIDDEGPDNYELSDPETVARVLRACVADGRALEADFQDVNYGSLDKIEAFVLDNRLEMLKSNEAGDDYGEGVAVYRDGKVEEFSAVGGSIAITIRDLANFTPERLAEIKALDAWRPGPLVIGDAVSDEPDDAEIELPNITSREFDTILAALRYWQREGLNSSGHEIEWIASEHGDPLTAEEIDELCGRINS